MALSWGRAGATHRKEGAEGTQAGGAGRSPFAPPGQNADEKPWAAVWASLRVLYREPEGEMALNRSVVALLLLFYIALVPSLHAPFPLAVAAGFLAYTAFFLIHVILRRGRRGWRILLAMLADFTALGLGLAAGGAAGAIFYPLFLWVILGNGLRFGPLHMRAASVLGLVAFTLAVLAEPYWRSQPPLAVGLGAGLVMLPAYGAKLIRRLSRAKEEAEAASRAKTQFLASVSHELRTPLNAVMGGAHLLLDHLAGSEEAEHARTILASSRALHEMIGKILDFSRLEAGHMPAPEEEFTLPALLADLIRLVGPEARAKGLRLGWHITARTPLALRGARIHIQEILLNLLANAVKFTPSGEVSLAIDAEAVGEERVQLAIEVSDTGIGIAREVLGRIFEPFTQADDTILSRFGGTGLGLAICRRLTELLGGRIGVESEPGRGSLFRLELPLRRGVEAYTPFPGEVVLISAERDFAARITALLPASVRPAVHPSLTAWQEAGQAGQVVLLDEMHPEAKPELIDALGTPRPPFILLSRTLAAGMPDSALPPPPWRCRALSRSGVEAEALTRALTLSAEVVGPAALIRPAARALSILIAEDNRTNQRVLAKLLERAGHNVALAENGEKALDMMMAERFDVVFMDLNMPVMNGIDAAKLYRFMAAGQPHLPIFALTADVTEEAQRLCAEAGMDGVLTKPFEPARLFDLLERIGRESPPPAAAAAEGEEGEVAELALHPRFRPAVSGVDTDVLDDLLKLGGPDFVTELIDAFLADSTELVAAMVEAARAGDSAGFRNHAHALCSASANIGARGLFELCLSWRLIQAQELGGERSAQLIQRLENERDRVRAALLAYRAGLVRRACET